MTPKVTTLLPGVTDVTKRNYYFRITQSLQANEYGHVKTWHDACIYLSNKQTKGTKQNDYIKWNRH
jgi:hypothetical protein